MYYLYARAGRDCSRQELGDAVWASDDDMALGAEKAIKEAGRMNQMWILGGAGMKDIVKRVMDNDPDLRRRVRVLRSTVPAITHVDYSARIQTVDEARNPRFHRLLTAFERLTGCPVLVNTSFNIRGEPIVCTPQDAYRCFLATDMDVLVLEDYIISKEDLTEEITAAAREEYRGQFQLD